MEAVSFKLRNKIAGDADVGKEHGVSAFLLTYFADVLQKRFS